MKKNSIWGRIKNFVLNSQQEKQQGKLDSLTPEGLEAETAKFNAVLNADAKYLKNKWVSNSNYLMRKAFTKYLKVDYKLHNKGLKGWRLEKIKPALRKEYKKSLLANILLITTQNESMMSLLRSRFTDWILKSSRDQNADSLKKALDITQATAKVNKRVNMIIKDQTRKSLNTYDEVVAKEYEAIGFIWNTRRDKKVVGNPTGLYPGNGNEKHRNHYERQGKFYFYKDTWAIKKGLINTKAKNFKWAEFEDGMPGIPINCRCFAYNIYDIEDVPKEFLKKNKKF